MDSANFGSPFRERWPLLCGGQGFRIAVDSWLLFSSTGASVSAALLCQFHTVRASVRTMRASVRTKSGTSRTCGPR
eukprot:353182-Chlamydomonas_euryale.AAC.34